MYNHLVPEYISSNSSIDLKKRKSPPENSEAATALLSLDEERSVESYKRFRPSHLPFDETRDLSPKTKNGNRENRGGDDENERSDSSPILTRRLMDQDELASALALASLAHSFPKRTEHPRVRTKNIDENIIYNRKSPYQPYRPYNYGVDCSFFHGYQQYPFDRHPPMPLDLMMRTNQHTRIEVPYVMKFLCDFCQAHSFSTYEDALYHEKVCYMNPGREAIEPHPSFLVQKNNIIQQYPDHSTLQVELDESKYFSGIIPLGIPEADCHALSEIYCYIRNECIEAFSANEDDVRKSSKRGRTNPKQVGLRCKFCAKVEVESQSMASVSYPVSANGIHESVKRWLKIHSPTCKFIPEDVNAKIVELQKTSSISSRRRYWIDSAKALGIEDTPGGLRFTRDVQNPNNAKRAAEILEGRLRVAKAVNKDREENKSCCGDIVFPKDAEMISPYLYLLLRQVERCQFTDTDLYIARSKVRLGFNGFQCRHCSGHNGLGKYFPLTPNALRTNSTSQNIFSHLQKCSECPDEIKEELKKKRIENLQSKRCSGWRQTFFDELWIRLHGEQSQIDE